MAGSGPIESEPSLLRRKWSAARSPVVCFELTQLELMKLHNIDVQKSSFQAQIWVEFTIHGGALDSNLSADGAVFPMGADGQPTFRPSAGWYMEQVEGELTPSQVQDQRNLVRLIIKQAIRQEVIVEFAPSPDPLKQELRMLMTHQYYEVGD